MQQQASDSNQVSGYFEIDGQKLDVTEGICSQVAVEDNTWRVLADVDNGGATFNEPEQGSVKLDTGEEWSISPNDDGPNITVSAASVHGESLTFVSGTDDDYVQFIANINCGEA